MFPTCRRIKMASHMKPSPATGTESADSTSNSTISSFNDPNEHIAETMTLHDGSASME